MNDHDRKALLAGSGTDPTLAPSVAATGGFEPTLPTAPGSVDPMLDATLPPGPSAAASAPVIRGGRTAAPQPADDHDELRMVDPMNYALGAELARGGMGRIRHARDLRLRRPVAVKELLATDRSLAERFEREILLTARLQHPSIVSIYEAGRWPSGEPFYAMRVVPGKSLDAVIEPLTALAERLAVLPSLIAVAEALAYAHAQRIIHRDLKPANVLIGPFGESVVIDWGLAKDLAATESSSDVSATPFRAAPDGDLTMVGSIMGTPAYMPPEQAAGESVDERADVYALGAILYHLLAGRAPFTGKTSDAVLVQVLSETPVPLATLVPEAPRDLVTLVHKAMARDAADRYATAAELAADLKRFQTGQLVGAHAYSRVALIKRWLRRHRGAVTVGVIALVALAVTGVISVRNIMSERDRAEVASAEAERKRAEANELATSLLVEHGRQELAASRPMRALPYLTAAYANRAGDPLLRLLVHEAMQAVEPELWNVEPVAGTIERVVVTDDGEIVVVGSDAVRVLDPSTGARRGTLVERHPATTMIRTSLDGRRLALAAGENSSLDITVWDVPSRKQLLTAHVTGDGFNLDPERDWVLSAAGDRVAIRTAEGIRVIDAGGVLATIKTPNYEGNQQVPVGFIADGTGLLVRRVLNDVAMVRLDTATVVSTETCFGPTLSHDATRLTCWENGQRRLIDLADGTVRVVAGGKPILGRANLVTATDPVSLISDTGTVVAVMQDTTDAVQVSVLDTRALVTTGAGTTELWDFGEVGPARRLATYEGGIATAFGPSHAIVLASGRGQVRLIPDPGSSTVDKTGRVDAWVMPSQDGSPASVSPDGTRVVAPAFTPSVALVWIGAATAPRELVPTSEATSPMRVTLSDDGTLITTNDGTGAVRIWNVASGELVSQLAAGAGTIAAVTSGDTTRVITAGSELALWDRSGTKLRARAIPSTGPGQQVFGVVADGSAVLARGAQGLVVWDTRADTIRELDGAVTGMLAPDGTLVVAYADHLALGTVTTPLRNVRFADAVRVEIAAGDRLIVTTGSGRAVVLHTSTGAEVASLGVPRRVIRASAFDHGRLVVALTADGQVVVADAATGHTLASRRPARVAFVIGARAAAVVVTVSETGVLGTWSVAAEPRSPDTIARYVAERVPWILRGSTLVRAN